MIARISILSSNRVDTRGQTTRRVGTKGFRVQFTRKDCLIAPEVKHVFVEGNCTQGRGVIDDATFILERIDVKWPTKIEDGAER